MHIANYLLAHQRILWKLCQVLSVDLIHRVTTSVLKQVKEGLNFSVTSTDFKLDFREGLINVDAQEEN